MKGADATKKDNFLQAEDSGVCTREESSQASTDTSDWETDTVV